jgi:branched-chain amino acid transport system ATP-binding protein
VGRWFAPANRTGRAEMIRLEHVSMKFGGLYALSDVSVEVDKGELFSIIGPNGSGKSTLFNVITGIYTPSSGRIYLRDRELTGVPPDRLNHLGVARTFQSPRLFTDATILENVMVPLLAQSKLSLFTEIFSKRQRERSYEELRPIAMNALDVVGLKEKAQRSATMLSHSDQKRVEIARCYAINPQMMMLDEPVAGLNTEERTSIKELISQLNRSGITILLIEHDMKIVMGISNRILVLNYGRVIAVGTPSEVTTNEDVIRAYLGVEEAADEQPQY